MVKGFTTHGPSALSRQRLTDWYEGGHQEGQRRTIEALLRLKLVGLGGLYLTTCCFFALALLAHAHCVLGRFDGWSALTAWLAVTVTALPVLRQLLRARNLSPEEAWTIVRSRQLVYLALFQMALFCGGAVALLIPRPCGFIGTLG